MDKWQDTQSHDLDEFADEDFLVSNEEAESDGPEEGEPQVEPKGDAAVGAALSKASKAGAMAAAGAGRSIAGGFSAIREVRRAAKQRSDAQTDLREIERGLEEDRTLLAHREDVERNFDSIVDSQLAEIEQAEQEAKEAETQANEQLARAKELKGELRAMRVRHEQKLRPYRNLMESSRGRSDDAAKALANARRSVRNAETALNSATKSRQQRIDAANRAVDNAQQRWNSVQNEHDALMQPDSGATSAAISKVEGELAAEQAHLEAARADVVQVTKEAQQSVDQAQKNLWAQQQQLSTAEKVAAEAKEKATAHKDEYDGMYRDAQAKEKAKEDAIRSCETRVRDLQKTQDDSLGRAKAAQVLLDEANEIHAHPETTEGLRQRIADEEEDLEAAEAELESLASNERELRRSTRGARIAFAVAIVVAIVLICVLVWFLASKK